MGTAVHTPEKKTKKYVWKQTRGTLDTRKDTYKQTRAPSADPQILGTDSRGDSFD